MLNIKDCMISFTKDQENIRENIEIITSELEQQDIFLNKFLKDVKSFLKSKTSNYFIKNITQVCWIYQISDKIKTLGLNIIFEKTKWNKELYYFKYNDKIFKLKIYYFLSSPHPVFELYHLNNFNSIEEENIEF